MSSCSQRSRNLDRVQHIVCTRSGSWYGIFLRVCRYSIFPPPLLLPRCNILSFVISHSPNLNLYIEFGNILSITSEPLHSEGMEQCSRIIRSIVVDSLKISIYKYQLDTSLLFSILLTRSYFVIFASKKGFEYLQKSVDAPPGLTRVQILPVVFFQQVDKYSRD